MCLFSASTRRIIFVFFSSFFSLFYCYYCQTMYKNNSNIIVMYCTFMAKLLSSTPCVCWFLFRSYPLSFITVRLFWLRWVFFFVLKVFFFFFSFKRDWLPAIRPARLSAHLPVKIQKARKSPPVFFNFYVLLPFNYKCCARNIMFWICDERNREKIRFSQELKSNLWENINV